MKPDHLQKYLKWKIGFDEKAKRESIYIHYALGYSEWIRHMIGASSTAQAQLP